MNKILFLVMLLVLSGCTPIKALPSLLGFDRAGAATTQISANIKTAKEGVSVIKAEATAGVTATSVQAAQVRFENILRVTEPLNTTLSSTELLVLQQAAEINKIKADYIKVNDSVAELKEVVAKEQLKNKEWKEKWSSSWFAGKFWLYFWIVTISGSLLTIGLLALNYFTFGFDWLVKFAGSALVTIIRAPFMLIGAIWKKIKESPHEETPKSK